MLDFKIDIPFFDTSMQYTSQKEEIDTAIGKVLNSGLYINGPEVSAFSSKLSSYLDVAEVVTCANGTDALYLALKALNLSKGDEVILPAFNFVSAAEVVALLELTPVFVDVNETDFNIDTTKIEKAITAKTKVIIAVHLFGAAADLDAIIALARRYNLSVIEDVAQSLGSEYKGKKLGTFGDMACTSFFPTKNLSCFGDGGAVFTNNVALAKKIRMVANHGQVKKYEHDVIGINSRLDTIQAAVLNVNLNHLDNRIAKRRQIAEKYNDAFRVLDGLQIPVVSEHIFHSFNQYCIKLENSATRDALQTYLKKQGVNTMIYYPKSTHLQWAFKPYGFSEGDFPVSERLSQSILALPIFPDLSISQQHYIIDCIKIFFDDLT